MAENKGSPGLSKLARVISQRAENVAGKAERDLVLDFGSIKGDMSLLTNTFPIPIPRSDYHVCRLVGGLAYTISGGSHEGDETYCSFTVKGYPWEEDETLSIQL